MSIVTPPVPDGRSTRPGLVPRPVPELAVDGEARPPSHDPPVVLADGRTAPASEVVSAGTLLMAALAVAGSSLLAYQVTLRGSTLIHNRMLPWILGRSLGLASFLTLTALVVLGTWLRHPWRRRVRSPRPEALLRAHVVLAAGTVVLLAGHLTSIALDHYAGVGWRGTFVPGLAHYRPTAVALGTIGLYAILLVGGTAALAGRIGSRVWYPVHTVSAVVFCLCLVHGVTAGSDSATLRWVYVVTGGTVALAQGTRWMARHTDRRVQFE